jgi:hypothetical protein
LSPQRSDAKDNDGDGATDFPNVVVTPDHESSPDRVVDPRKGFTVIEKTGEEAQLVEEQDPRSKGNSSSSQ